MLLRNIKFNKANPRIIKDYKFHQLVKSLKEFPKMMELRPIIIDNDGTVLGGNMRLKALQSLELQEIPDTWVKKASELTDEEKQRFIIADNNSFGEWDWDSLAMEWDAELLTDWGVDTPDFEEETAFNLKDGDRAPFQDMKFTLSDEQAEKIKEALKLTKEYETFGNENKNGNHLYFIIREWEELKK